MKTCPVCQSDRIVSREDEFRCRKCGYVQKITLTLSKRTSRELSETTRMRISNSMSKVWKKRKKNPKSDEEYRDKISQAMKKRAIRDADDSSK